MVILTGSARGREVTRGVSVFSFTLSSRSVLRVVRLSGKRALFFGRRGPRIIREFSSVDWC